MPKAGPAWEEAAREAWPGPVELAQAAEDAEARVAVAPARVAVGQAVVARAVVARAVEDAEGQAVAPREQPAPAGEADRPPWMAVLHLLPATTEVVAAVSSAMAIEVPDRSPCSGCSQRSAYVGAGAHRTAEVLESS
jgi:hypothetical protein